MSSAHARKTPALRGTRSLSKHARKGSKARLKKKADPGQPWRTPERNRSNIIYSLSSLNNVYTRMDLKSFKNDNEN